MVTITCANSGSYTNIRLVVNSVREGGFSYSLSFSGGSGSPIRGTIPSTTDAQNLVSLLSNAIRSQASLDAAVKSSALTAIRAHRDDLNPLFGTARTTAPAPVPPRPVPVVAPSPRVVSPPVAQRPAVRPTAVSPPAPSRPAPVTARPVVPAPLPSPAPVRTTEITDPLSNSARLSAYLDDFRENPQRNFAQLRSNYQNFANDLQNPRARVNLINAILSTPQGALYLGSPNAQIPTDLGNPSLDSLKSFVSSFLRNSQNIPPNARSAIAQILPPTGSLSDQQLLLASFAFLCATRNSSFNQFLTSVQSNAVTAPPPQVVAPPPVVVPAPSPTPEPAPQTLDPTATSILATITSGTLTRSSLDQIRNYSSVSDLLMQRVYESLQVSSHPLSSQLRSFRRTHADSPTSLGQFVQSLASSNSRYAQDLQALSTNVLHQDPNFFRDGSFLRHPDSTKYTLMALSIASWRFTSTNIQVNDRPWAQVSQTTPDAGVRLRAAW